MPTFLVTGATGRQGGATAQLLLDQGVKVHALVRNPDSEAAKAFESKGTNLFEGDLANSAAISKAIEGVEGVFFNPPYPGPDFVSTCETFIATCSSHKNSIKTFVVSSATGTELHQKRLEQNPQYTMVAYFTMRSKLEDLAKKAGFQNLVILRPPFLMHNYGQGWSEKLFPELKTDHKLVTALRPETKVPHLKAEDVGLVASTALMNPELYSGREINLAAENLDAMEVAEIMSDVAGTKIEAVIPEADGDKVQSPVAPYHRWANEIDATVDTAALEDYGFKLTSLKQFFQERPDELKEVFGI